MDKVSEAYALMAEIRKIKNKHEKLKTNILDIQEKATKEIEAQLEKLTEVENEYIEKMKKLIEVQDDVL
jgi:uncharacterized protein YlxW (UPF0749 family)